MSSSHFAAYEDCVEISFVKETCPDEFHALETFLNDHKSGLDEFMMNMGMGGEQLPDIFDENGDYNEGIDETCQKLWEALKAMFKIKTGLELRCTFFQAEERSDELDGASFCVDEVYQYTLAGEKYKDKITRKTWCTFG